MNRIFRIAVALLLVSTITVPAQIQIHRGDSDRVASEVVTVQNRFLRIVVNPARGGVIQSFTYRGEELTRDEGILQDHLWDLGHGVGGFYGEPYLLEIKQLPGRVVLHLSKEGTKGSYQFLEIHKSITLLEDECGVLVTYSFRNQVRSQTPITVFPWFNHILGTAGPNTYFIPTEEGIKRVSYDPDHVDWGGEDPRANLWFNNPSRGWSGLVGKDHVGLVCLPEYKYLHCVYTWLGKNLATLEWRFIPASVQPGKEFTTSFTLIPFKGLMEISGAGGGIVASLDRPNHRVLLVSHRKQQVRLQVRIKGPDGKEERQADVALMLEPDTVASVPFSPPDGNGGLVYCEITDHQGKYLADVEGPLEEG
ncbi:MAG: hypothetical protein HY318_16110, partial [Armatimonadetes bacterium]|nr:hypothetical protein [Armatimonadota bacterium]